MYCNPNVMKANVLSEDDILSKSIIDKNLLHYKDYHFYPKTEALVIGISTWVVISLTTFFIYYYSLEAQKGEIREGLLRTAQVISTLVDTNVHNAFFDKSQETGRLYQTEVAKLKKALNANKQIAYVYTLIMRNNKVYFVLDPTPEGDTDGDGYDDKVHIMEEYTDVSGEAVEALTKHIPVVVKEPYKDQWGSFVGGFVPLFNEENKSVGVLAVDITAKNYFARLYPIQRATIRTMVAAFFISFLVMSFIWFLRNFSRIIHTKRVAIIEKVKTLNNIG